jgi:hypothetical protein
LALFTFAAAVLLIIFRPFLFFPFPLPFGTMLAQQDRSVPLTVLFISTVVSLFIIVLIFFNLGCFFPLLLVGTLFFFTPTC